MKMIYMLVKAKDDFCQNVQQLKNLLTSNCRITFSEETLEIEKRKLSYRISVNEVEASNETVFRIEVTAKQPKDEDKVTALEKFDELMNRVAQKIADLNINTVWDNISLYYGKKLYPEISEVEALLREIIYLFMINNVGSEWFNTRTSNRFKAELNKIAQKNNYTECPKIDSLIYADFITLGTFFFEKYALKTESVQLFEKLKNKENYTEENMAKIIEQFEPKSNWDRYFSDKISVDNLIEKWNKLYNYRNRVAHTKKLTKFDYTDAKKIIDELRAKFSECLAHMDEVEMTEEQSDAVEEVAQKTLNIGNVLRSTTRFYGGSTDWLGNALSSGIIHYGKPISSLYGEFKSPFLSDKYIYKDPITDSYSIKLDELTAKSCFDDNSSVKIEDGNLVINPITAKSAHLITAEDVAVPAEKAVDVVENK